MQIKKIVSALAVIFFVGLISLKADAFQLLGKKESYLGSRYLTMGLGLGFSGITEFEGVSGGPGFGFEIDLGHEFSQSLTIDFAYKFSLVGFTTPSPIDTTQKVNSTFIFNSEAFRLIYKYARFNIQPYIYVGIGMYNFNSVDSKTGMNFPLNLQIPVGAGVLAYIYRDKLSLKAGLDWHNLIGENQRVEVLNLLGIKSVSFDVYSVMFTLTWYIY